MVYSLDLEPRCVGQSACVYSLSIATGSRVIGSSVMGSTLLGRTLNHKYLLPLVTPTSCLSFLLTMMQSMCASGTWDTRTQESAVPPVPRL